MSRPDFRAVFFRTHVVLHAPLWVCVFSFFFRASAPQLSLCLASAPTHTTPSPPSLTYQGGVEGGGLASCRLQAAGADPGTDCAPPIRPALAPAPCRNRLLLASGQLPVVSLFGPGQPKAGRRGRLPWRRWSLFS
ncbi:hypothetical protein GQ53DRAFT_220580 [Thozetella sp. PMI_491]|nr:hypothetical protein GQ53DRAFT_220580 [Thozetella sp. PMI_491]